MAVDRSNTAEWHALADRVWRALAELGRIGRQIGGVRGVGIGWDFERGIHLLYAQGDPEALAKLPAELDGFRVVGR